MSFSTCTQSLEFHPTLRKDYAWWITEGLAHLRTEASSHGFDEFFSVDPPVRLPNLNGNPTDKARHDVTYTFHSDNTIHEWRYIVIAEEGKKDSKRRRDITAKRRASMQAINALRAQEKKKARTAANDTLCSFFFKSDAYLHT